jgi:hypothetical protein
MALRTRVKAIVMFAGVIKHRLNRTNTANILARLEDTMSWLRNFNFNLNFNSDFNFDVNLFLSVFFCLSVDALLFVFAIASNSSNFLNCQLPRDIIFNVWHYAMEHYTTKQNHTRQRETRKHLSFTELVFWIIFFWDLNEAHSKFFQSAIFFSDF